MNIDKDDAKKWEHEAREKEEKITQWGCFGIVFMCHCFIKDGYLIYFIPLAFSLFSIGADWYSDWRYYHYYEEHIDDNKEEIVPPNFNELWRLVPFALAMLSFMIFYLHYYLLIKID